MQMQGFLFLRPRDCKYFCLQPGNCAGVWRGLDNLY
jgi:hypothetical protein